MKAPAEFAKLPWATGALGGVIFVAGVASGWLWIPVPTRLSPSFSADSRAAQWASSIPGDALSSAGRSGLTDAEPTEFLSRLHMALSLTDRRKRERAFSEIANGFDATALQDAIAHLCKLHIADRAQVLSQLFARWAELDPPSALAAAQRLTKTAERNGAVNAVLGVWTEQNHDAAEQWVAALPEGAAKISAWETLIEAVAVIEPAHALDLAQKLQLSWHSAAELVEVVMDSWIGTHPREAAAHAAELPPGELRTAALQRVAEQWARADLPQALVWADAIPNQEFVVHPMSSSGIGPLFAALKAFVETDSEGAIQWLEQLPEGKKKASLISSACTSLSFGSPTPQSADRLVALLPAGARRDDVLQQLAQQITREKPAMALEWVRAQSDPEDRRIILSGVLPHLSGSELVSALQLVASIDAGGRENLIITESLGKGWSLDDPATLAHWASEQPNSQQYLDRIAASWANTNAPQASAWLTTLPAAARDTALRGIVDEALSRVPVDSPFDTATHFQNAERWIAQMSSQNARESCYQRLGERWRSIDPDAAQAWLDTRR